MVGNGNSEPVDGIGSLNLRTDILIILELLSNDILTAILEFRLLPSKIFSADPLDKHRKLFAAISSKF